MKDTLRAAEVTQSCGPALTPHSCALDRGHSSEGGCCGSRRRQVAFSKLGVLSGIISSNPTPGDGSIVAGGNRSSGEVR